MRATAHQSAADMCLSSAMACLRAWLLLLAGMSAVSGGSFAGPYVINIKSFSNCPTHEVDNQVSPLDLDMHTLIKHNPSTKLPVMDGNVTVRNDMFTRGASKVLLDVAKWDTVSGWRDHFIVMPIGELCFVLEEVVGVNMKYFAGPADAPEKCPAPNRVYSGTNVPLQLASLGHFPSLPYGRFRVHTIFTFARPTKGPNVRGCFRIVTDIVPRPQKPVA